MRDRGLLASSVDSKGLCDYFGVLLMCRRPLETTAIGFYLLLCLGALIFVIQGRRCRRKEVN